MALEIQHLTPMGLDRSGAVFSAIEAREHPFKADWLKLTLDYENSKYEKWEYRKSGTRVWNLVPAGMIPCCEIKENSGTTLKFLIYVDNLVQNEGHCLVQNEGHCDLKIMTDSKAGAGYSRSFAPTNDESYPFDDRWVKLAYAGRKNGEHWIHMIKERDIRYHAKKGEEWRFSVKVCEETFDPEMIVKKSVGDCPRSGGETR